MSGGVLSSWNRELYGVTCTAANGKRRVTFNVPAATGVIPYLDALADGPWKVEAMSTPDSILRDLCGSTSRQQGARTPESLIAAVRPDLVIDQFISRNRGSHSYRNYGRTGPDSA